MIIFRIIKWILREFSLKEFRFIFQKCHLCNGIILIKFNNTIAGLRCLKCTATLVHMGMIAALKNIHTNISDKKIYEMSAHGAFFLYLRKHCINLTFSEYFENITPGNYFNNIQCQDIRKLTYTDNSFDICTSTGVFEHIQDDVAGYSEIYRVLKNDGIYIFSIPIHNSAETIERVKIENEKVVYLKEPNYHDDITLKGLEKSLVWRDYGFDIKEKLKNIGFVNVEIYNIPDIILNIKYDIKNENPSTKIVVAYKGEENEN